MLPSRLLRFSAALAFLHSAQASTNPFTQYAVDFPDPNRVAAGNLPKNLAGAEDTIVAWADEMNSYGPWSVTFKQVLAPSGDKHDYMSWAPYHWPNCTGIPNSASFTPPEIWEKCPYITRDGEANPDRILINDFQSFFNLSDAVLYNSIAAVLQGTPSSSYSQNVAKFIDTWFLNNDTFMNPNLNYAQMDRGPTGQMGTFTGPLDLRGMAKIASGILMLRKTKNSDWTEARNAQFVAWCNKYIGWLQTAPQAKSAAAQLNNHGTIFVSQLAALKLVVGDTNGAVSLIQGYFSGIFKGQINSNGEQVPKRSDPHTPIPLSEFNAGGMITNARLLSYADPTLTPSGWNATTQQGATIQKAMDFLMTVNPATSQETNVTIEIYPNIAAVASAYGDASGKYGTFLNKSGFPYANDATFLWDQPLAGGDLAAESEANHTGSAAGSTSGVPAPTQSATNKTKNGSLSRFGRLELGSWAAGVLGVIGLLY
ncbi:chondroitin AC/alginate lyase [Roridomyces roridus]|uniref:Chondroitin AC/alginate lyase n=1 Tax=Roridomyces roridus TaxID=1738132 RepID=A0AAD7FVA5_9AGAR|nr:chondroitin AC/alginate lyase [Roridomyces roridus]